jgi:hypothetical protein
VGEVDPGDNMAAIKTPSGKIEVHIPELADEAKELMLQAKKTGFSCPRNFP